MKIKIQLITLLLLISIISYGQALQTIKTYHDPFTRSKLHEIYTVKKDTGIKQGTYKSFNENGYPQEEATFNNNVLHGSYKVYKLYAPKSGLLAESGIYNNGKKNGEWLYYYYNMFAADKHYLEKKISYKDDVAIAKTTYYPSSKKKFHAEQTGDIRYCKQWYENGTLESEAIYKITVGNYGENEEPIKIINYNENGVLTAKYENDITYIYSEDGTNLVSKEDKTKKYTEYYKNGEVVQTIQEYRDHNDRTVFEVIEYINGGKLSRKVIDANGQDMEAKYERDNLQAEYTALRNQLDELRLEALPKVMIQNNNNGNCRKSKYESDKVIDKLSNTYYQRTSVLDKMVSEKKRYNIMLDKVDKDQIESIQNYIAQINEYYVPQKGTLISISRGIGTLTAKLYQIECEYTTVKNNYKGTTYLGSTLEVTHKKNLYKDYSLISDYLMDRTKKEDNLSEMLLAIQQYNIISDNLLKWRSAKTSDIEKQLKNAKTIQGKLEIFLSGGGN